MRVTQLSKVPQSDATPQHPSVEYPDPIPKVLLQGSVNLFMGSPHAGKTIESTALACRLRDGRSFAGLKTNRQHVGLITTDHRWKLDQGYWFTKAGWPDIPHVSLKDRSSSPWRVDWFAFKKDERERVKILRLCLRELNLPVGMSTLLVDVGQPFITNRINDYMEVMAGVNTLGEVTYDEFGLTTLLFGHLGKQKEHDQYKKLQERIAGSVAQIGFSDTAIALQSPEDLSENGLPADYAQLDFFPRHTDAFAFKLSRDPDGFFVPYTPPKVAGPLDAVVSELPTTGLRYADLLALVKLRCGVSDTRAKERIANLTKDGRVVKVDGMYLRGPAS